MVEKERLFCDVKRTRDSHFGVCKQTTLEQNLIGHDLGLLLCSNVTAQCLRWECFGWKSQKCLLPGPFQKVCRPLLCSPTQELKMNSGKTQYDDFDPIEKKIVFNHLHLDKNEHPPRKNAWMSKSILYTFKIRSILPLSKQQDPALEKNDCCIDFCPCGSCFIGVKLPATIS